MSEIPPRVLRDALHGQTSGSSSGCLDADTLAAWADGALGVRARTAVEAHASSCARCQALLAAMVKTTPPASSPTAWWRSWKLAWLAPIAAAAAAVVLWINMPGLRRDDPGASTAASAAKEAAPTSVAAVPVGARAAAPPPAARSDRQARAKEADSLKVASAPAPTVAAAPLQEATADQRRADDANATAGEMRAAAASRSADVPMAKLSAVPALVLSPNPNVRWRILPDGGVARTTDGGATWQAQSTGMPVALSAGAAPSPTVCWLVGPGGSVVLSTDGQSWQRVPFPAAVDLTSIRASDTANATVTAADGRTFSTTDGGNTWR